MKDLTIPEWDQYSHDVYCPMTQLPVCVVEGGHNIHHYAMLPKCWGCGNHCICGTIAQARADERMKVMQQALQMVGDIYTGTTTHGDDWHDRAGSSVKRDAMAALESLAGK